jgi:fucose permease
MLVPNVAVSVVGFMIAGLGTSILFPQLYDRAAKAPGPPGSGFASMLIGQRGAGVLAPLVVGALADTAAFGVGQAMAVVVLPSAVIVYLTTLARAPLPPTPRL